VNKQTGSISSGGRPLSSLVARPSSSVLSATVSCPDSAWRCRRRSGARPRRSFPAPEYSVELSLVEGAEEAPSPEEAQHIASSP
jgi:hypothetical protein